MPPAAHRPDPGNQGSIVEFVRRTGRGVVATVTEGGAPQAALVGLCALDNGTLVFNSLETARKIRNLEHDGRVAVVVEDDSDVCLQIEGTASLATGAARVRFGAAYARQFPGSRSLDAGFAVVVVRPSWVRVYDASGTSAVVTEAVWRVTDERLGRADPEADPAG